MLLLLSYQNKKHLNCLGSIRRRTKYKSYQNAFIMSTPMIKRMKLKSTVLFQDVRKTFIL